MKSIESNTTWVTNVHKSGVYEDIRYLCYGHNGKRTLLIGKPQSIAGKMYSKPELIRIGMVGLYEPEKCTCNKCKEKNKDVTLTKCDIVGCLNPAEQINTLLFSSGMYCRKHFVEIDTGKVEK